MSARRMVERRCAITKTVRPVIKLLSALCTSISDSESSSEVASSRIRIGASFSKRARNGEPLPLAAGKPLSAVADDRLVALRHLHDEIVRQRCLRRGIHLFFRHVRPAVAEIVPDGVVEQNGFLRHDRHLFAQRPQSHIAHIIAVDAHDARGGRMEARQKIDKRRLARAA